MARSFAGYGQRVSGPQVGAIAVMGGEVGGGHVGVVSGIDAQGNPIVISGNYAIASGRCRCRGAGSLRYVLPELIGDTPCRVGSEACPPDDDQRPMVARRKRALAPLPRSLDRDGIADADRAARDDFGKDAAFVAAEATHRAAGISRSRAAVSGIDIDGSAARDGLDDLEPDVAMARLSPTRSNSCQAGQLLR
jgi:hypothetical protein